MKGNEKSILIGSVVIAILIVHAAYKFFYLEDMAKVDEEQGKINTLQVRMDELNAKNANRAMYEAGIAESADIIDTVLSLYGPGNTPEKTIMMVVDLCKKTGVAITDISFQDDKLIYASETLDENNKPEIQIYKGGMSVNISSGYTQLKKLTDYINSHPERMNAENFTAAFDAQSGRINIKMNVNMYAVKDKNHTYEAPVVEDIELGNPNIFKVVELPEEEETEEGAEGAEGAGNEGASETTVD